jgi:chorismate mutase
MSFEAAQAGMNQAMTQGSGDAPAANASVSQGGSHSQTTSTKGQGSSSPHGGTGATEQDVIDQLLDLDASEKFRFQGREWTPEELQRSIMLEKDYRKKTTDLSREQKYIANLASDLRQVKADPRLADEFKRIYPEAYHGYLDLILEQAKVTGDNSLAGQTSANQNQIPEALAKRLEALEGRLKSVDEKEHAANVAQIEQRLDQLFGKLQTKYEWGVEEQVLAKAEALIAKGYKMNDAVWERLWKASHEHHEGKARKWRDAETQAQLKKNQEGGDIGRGGSTPSAGPKRFKSLGDVTDHMVASLTKG